MLLLGLVLFVLGLVLGIGLLETLGILCLVIGLVLVVLAHSGTYRGPVRW